MLRHRIRYEIYAQNVIHKENMKELEVRLERIKRQMAKFMYDMTGDKAYLEECEYEIKNKL